MRNHSRTFAVTLALVAFAASISASAASRKAVATRQVEFPITRAFNYERCRAHSMSVGWDASTATYYCNGRQWGMVGRGGRQQ